MPTRYHRSAPHSTRSSFLRGAATALATAAMLLHAVELLAKPPTTDAYQELGIKSSEAVRVVYYYVHGDPEGLHSEMLRRGPKDSRGRPRFALTHWNITWRWPQKNGVPQFDRVSCKLHFTLTLPRWYPLRDPGVEAKKRWQEFTRRVAAHEKRHMQIAQEGFPSVCEKIRLLAEEKRAISAHEANKIAQRELAKIHTAEEYFDRASQNGAADGVRWP